MATNAEVSLGYCLNQVRHSVCSAKQHVVYASPAFVLDYRVASDFHRKDQSEESTQASVKPTSVQYQAHQMHGERL